MRQIQISGGHIALVDDSDYDALMRHKWTAQPDRRPNGSIRSVYAMRVSKKGEFDRKTKLYMHRVIVGAVARTTEVDHSDHNGLNNQRHNLRVGTRTHNMHNMRPHLDNKTGIRGVMRQNNKWVAKICIHRVHHNLGLFESPQEAAAAYAYAAYRFSEENPFHD